MTSPIMPGSSPVWGSQIGAEGAAKPDEQMGKDTFLKLLVAQLKYQDPMSPADGTQFMAQTAQFSMVEKLEELAKQNSELLASNRSLGASTLLGAEVTYAGLDGKDIDGTVTGVKFSPTGPILMVGDTEVSYSGIKEVRPPASAGGAAS